jgi:RimJ/RimL family protein N-acetyltransferase
VNVLKHADTVLRDAEDRDLDVLFALRNDVPLQLLLAAHPQPNTPDQVLAWLNKRRNDRHAVFFVIADAIGDACGYLQLTHLDVIDGHGQLGICIAPSAQGKGHAADAVALLEQYARDVLALRKIILTVLTSNVRAVAFYRRIGYSDIGIYRDHFHWDDAYHDMLAMEKLL